MSALGLFDRSRQRRITSGVKPTCQGHCSTDAMTQNGSVLLIASSCCRSVKLPGQLARLGEVIMVKADEDAIRDIEWGFNEAWGRHDADGMVESLADDAQFVTVNGAWTKTRADYLDLMQRLHGPAGPFR